MNYRNLVNIAGFYLCWWICVYGAINEKYFLGISILSVYTLLHFIFLTDSHIEYLYIFICFFLSFMSDSFFMYFNFISYKGYMPYNFNIIPFWTLTLWLCFSLSVFHSFSFLRRKYFYASILGLISGPIIYYSISKAGLIEFLIKQSHMLLIISIVWALFFPLYFLIADKLAENYAS